MGAPSLQIEHLTIVLGKEKQTKTVVSDLSLQIEPGQCMGLVGESGSGKTLSALSIVQLLPLAARVSDRSRIQWKDKNLLTLSEKEMRKVRGLEIGMIFQDAMSAFNPVLTIGQQMQEILKRKSARHSKKHAFDLLMEVGISFPKRIYHAYPHQLSGGMRQRAMIAMALCGEPDLIIADEPTTALDVTLQAQILALLNELKKNRQLTVLFISHDLAVVSQLADDITVLKHGHIVEAASKREFFLNPKHEYSQKLLAAIPSQKVRHTKTTSETILKIENLKVYFPIRKGVFKRKVGDIKAVDGISFALKSGETCALVGESGSGKTTTGLAIEHLAKATAGKIIFNGTDINTLSRRQLKKLRKDVQMIFQDPYAALNPRMMIADSIAEGLATQKIIRSRKKQIKKVDELLEKVGLSPDQKWRYPHEFSGGERQRICIARALALEPKILILDEPTSALDVSIQLQILELLEKLQKEHQLAYLLITHNLGVVAYLSQQTVVMHQGKIVEQGATEVLLNNPQQAYTQRLMASLPRIKIED